MKTVNVGIIGGGLMGKEVASAFGRWFAINDYPLKIELKGVCDINEDTLAWYKQLDSVNILTTDYRELLTDPGIDVVYVALPHHLHLEYYQKVIDSGKDLLAEKPFGIDLKAAQSIKDQAKQAGCFVRCSSEMPFLPGPQRLIKEVQSGSIGEIIEINAGFYHSSDMDPLKPINWKRQSKYCGNIGVMGDLGMPCIAYPIEIGVASQSRLCAVTKNHYPSAKSGGWME